MKKSASGISVETLIFLAVLVTAIATVALAWSSLNTVKLMRFNMLLENSPLIKVRLEIVEGGEAKFKTVEGGEVVWVEFKEDTPKLKEWVNKGTKEHNYVRLVVQNLQTAPMGIGYKIKIEHRIEYPDSESPVTLSVIKNDEFREIQPKENIKKPIYIWDSMPYFKAEILKISYLNPLTKKVENYKGYLPYSIAYKDEETGKVGHGHKYFK